MNACLWYELLIDDMRMVVRLHYLDHVTALMLGMTCRHELSKCRMRPCKRFDPRPHWNLVGSALALDYPAIVTWALPFQVDARSYMGEATVIDFVLRHTLKPLLGEIEHRHRGQLVAHVRRVLPKRANHYPTETWLWTRMMLSIPMRQEEEHNWAHSSYSPEELASLQWYYQHVICADALHPFHASACRRQWSKRLTHDQLRFVLQ